MSIIGIWLTGYNLLQCKLQRATDITFEYIPVGNEYLIHIIWGSKIHSPPGRLEKIFSREWPSFWMECMLCYYCTKHWFWLSWFTSDWHLFSFHRQNWESTIKKIYNFSELLRFNSSLHVLICNLPGRAQLPALTCGSLFLSTALSAV